MYRHNNLRQGSIFNILCPNHPLIAEDRKRNTFFKIFFLNEKNRRRYHRFQGIDNKELRR